ncbi:MAG TPA: hypothetical protein VJQ79_13195 [Acidimicrobiia bacterium]|nr:hypothetical protein [Acidimicrobiia bacterium]
MSDTGIRLAVIGVIVVIVLMAAAVAGRARKARPRRSTRDDLPPGVHLFTSTTCATCTEARAVITSVYGSSFSETRHEEDPQSFGRHGIARVPTAIVVLADRHALVFEGVPRKRHLPVVPPASIART